MATITQRLAFLISANADSAIRAFEKTSNAAEKEMAKAEKSLAKTGASLTKFGAAGLAAAGTLGGGLFKLAQGAIDDQKAQALLAQQLRTSTGATNQQIKAVEDLIDKTARATGVADDQLRPAYANLVRVFGDTDKASRALTTALDLSRATGRDLQAVTLALGKAASGNVGPLQKLGITFDENTKKSKNFDAILAAVNDRVGGASAAYAETYAGKLDRMKVAVSEAGESLGSAFIPVIEQAANVLGTGATTLQNFNDKTGGAIGKVAAFGTVGLGVVSSLSLVAGQVIKLRDRFTVLGDDGERSLTKLGSAAKYASLGIAAIGLSEVAFGVINQLNDSSGKLERSLQDLNIAIKNVDASSMLRQFRELVKEQDNTLRFSNIWSDFGKEITVVGGEASRNIEDIDRAFKQVLKESGPKAAQALLDAWREQNKTLDTSSQQYKDNAMLIQRYQSQVDSLVGSQKALNEINNKGVIDLNALKNTYESFSKAMANVKDRQVQLDYDKAVAATRERQAAADKAAAAATAKYEKEVGNLATALQNKLANALAAAEENASKANEAYKNYRDSISGSVTGVVNFGAAQAKAAENATKLKDANDALFKATGESAKLANDPNATADQIAEASQKVADAREALYQANKLPVTFSDVLKEQVKTAGDFKGNLQKILDLGGDQALIDQLTSAGADAGNAIISGILSSADPKGKVEELKRTLDSVKALGETIGVAAADQFFSTGVALATELLKGVKETVDSIDIDKIKGGKNAKKRLKQKGVSVDTTLGLLFGAAGVDVPQMADGGIVPASPGGTLVRVGEGGRDEAILPLPAPTQSPSIINITVNAGMGADGTQVGKQIVDELVAYQRRVGALPIKVNG